uniref:Neuroblastoma-amplified sequence n=1 Tax=Steinernema glaseri TaxID=37863 RepID=A0A1I8AQQ0_9BILA
MAEREIDQEYLAKLEKRLKQLRDPNKEFKSKDVFKEITESREDRLFNLLTAAEPGSGGFDDNFLDVPIKASYLQRKIAPQTVAVNKQEKLELVKNDQLSVSQYRRLLTNYIVWSDLFCSRYPSRPSPSSSNVGMRPEEAEDRLGMAWEETQFVSFTKCNTYGLHIIQRNPRSPVSESPDSLSSSSDVVLCVNQSGLLIFPNGEGAPCQLSDLLEPSLSEGCHSLELVSSDTAPHRHNDCEAFIATCWVGFDERLDHVKYLASIFIVDSEFNVRLGCNFEINVCPAYCRITKPTPLTRNMHSWLVFSSEKQVDCYLVSSDGKTELIEDMFNVYPGLDLGDLAGAATRTACIYNPEYRWSAVAFDTGHVTVTISQNDEEGFIVDRKSVKYNNVISFLHFLNKGLPPTETYLLVSSTSGPPVMWHLSLIDDQMRWNYKTVFDDWTTGTDAVLCGAVNDNSVCIGTFGNVMLSYDLDDVLSISPVPVNHDGSIAISAAVLSIQFLSDGSMAMLSSSGYHCFAPVKETLRAPPSPPPRLSPGPS